VDGFEGFRDFMTAHGGQLSRFAYLLTGDHHAAEDPMQSALAKVVALR
jgi:DNA-directed RNA polymerase specialized sigma24 family protein